MTLTLILATVGRPTLPRTLHSLNAQDWRGADEVIVASDGNHDEVARLLARHARFPHEHLVVQGGPHNDWGHTPRNLAMPRARGTHIAHLDDDDILTPGAVAQIHLDLDVNPAPVHLYRFIKFKDRRLVWLEPPQLAPGRVGTPNIVHPNRPETFGVWAPRYGGDGDFIVDTCKKVGAQVWHPHVTCVVGPPADWDLDRVLLWLAGRPVSLGAPTALGRLVDARFRRPAWKAPAGCGVLAASDDACFPGLQLLWHTLTGRCPLAAVDLGLNRRNGDWLRARALVLTAAGPFHRDHACWQTWNKPWYFRRSPFARTLWLDCDTVVCGSLLPLFERLGTYPLVVRHWDEDRYGGDIGPAVPAPRHPLPPGKSVNAGVVGLVPGRHPDEALLGAWQEAGLMAARAPAVAAGFRWQDESALHWALRQTALWDAVVADHGWNRLSYPGPRKAVAGSPSRFLYDLPYAAGDQVLHYSIKVKPWRYWGAAPLLWE